MSKNVEMQGKGMTGQSSSSDERRFDKSGGASFMSKNSFVVWGTVAVVCVFLVIFLPVYLTRDMGGDDSSSNLCDGTYSTNTLFHPEYTLTKSFGVFEPYNSCVAPWDFSLAQAAAVNNSQLKQTGLDPQDLKTCGVDTAGLPTPAGFLYNGVVQGYNESEIMMRSAFAMGDNMVGQAEELVDLNCDGYRFKGAESNQNCCGEEFVARGGCASTKAQDPICPFSYLYQTPSVTDIVGKNVEANPISQFKSSVGPQFKRVTRQAHAKGIACMIGEWRVNEAKDLPEKYRRGIFKEPGANFTAIVRWAGQINFAPKDLHDLRIKGMGVKLLGVDKETYGTKLPSGEYRLTPTLGQVPYEYLSEGGKKAFGEVDLKYSDSEGVIDFHSVAIQDTPTEHPSAYNAFIAQDSQAYAAEFINGTESKSTELPNANRTGIHLNQFKYVFGNAAPNRFGYCDENIPGGAEVTTDGKWQCKGSNGNYNGAMKYFFKLCDGEFDKLQMAAGDRLENLFNSSFGHEDFYWTTVREALDNSATPSNPLPSGALDPILPDGLKYCVHVQIQEEACRDSIEDHVEKWGSEEVVVAEITIPAQPIVYDGWCEGLLLTPFRQLLDHYPVGSLNRLRNVIYPYSQLYRTRANCLHQIAPCEESNPYDYNNTDYRGTAGRNYPSAEFYAPGRFGDVGGRVGEHKVPSPDEPAAGTGTIFTRRLREIGEAAFSKHLAGLFNLNEKLENMA